MDSVEEATDPEQYDATGSVDWVAYDQYREDPTKYFFEQFIPDQDSVWSEQSILDVGCGTGWLLNMLQDYEPDTLTGIDPSHRNIAAAQDKYPDITFHATDLQSFQPEDRYDTVFSVMVFGHIDRLDDAFTQIDTVLEDGGQFFLGVPSYNYLKMPRHDYEIDVTERGDEEYLIRFGKENWMITEIVRKPAVYRRHAAATGFSLTDEWDIQVDETLSTRNERYQGLENVVTGHLFQFTKE